jgi:hypothetical protein
LETSEEEGQSDDSWVDKDYEADPAPEMEKDKEYANFSIRKTLEPNYEFRGFRAAI